MSGSKLAHLDWYCWWTAFVIGVFYMVIIVLPVFGWLTAAALPFETVCAILPAQGENAGLASVGCGDGPRVDACCGCGGLLDTVHMPRAVLIISVAFAPRWLVLTGDWLRAGDLFRLLEAADSEVDYEVPT
eukprot:2946027-Rhodomonas_salina.2